jgi:hypothetical protein
MTGMPRDRWSTALGFAIAALALAQALQAANGFLQTEAIRWLTLAGAAALAGAFAPAHPAIERAGPRAIVLMLGLGLAYQFAQLLTNPPGMYVRPGLAGGLGAFKLGLWIAAALAGASLLAPRYLARWTFPLLLLVFLYLGRWMLVASPDPTIDAYIFQRDAANALADGHNPYALRYPDIYGGGSDFYGKGLSVGGILQFGYPYPPLSLLLIMPAHLLLGDYRYTQVLAMALTAALMAYAGPGRIGVAAALLLLFTPRAFFVLEQGWTDPLVVFGFAAAAVCALKWRRQLPWVLGLALAVKQYTIFMLPAALHLVTRPISRSGAFVLTALGVTAGITLPFLLWDPGNFWHSVVMLQILQPFRPESLSYLALVATGGTTWLASVGFLAAAAGLGLGLWRQPHTPAGFAATCALAYLGFFAFNKQAFANYYYFALGVLLVTIAVITPDDQADVRPAR